MEQGTFRHRHDANSRHDPTAAWPGAPGDIASLDSTVCAYFRELRDKRRPCFVAVEPEVATCLLQSIHAGAEGATNPALYRQKVQS